MLPVLVFVGPGQRPKNRTRGSLARHKSLDYPAASLAIELWETYMPPISVQHLTTKLKELKVEMDAGKLRHGEYDQRLARLIGELRDRKVQEDRAVVVATLDDLLAQGTITPTVKTHLVARLGLE
jgi:hypothetical protein